MTRPDRLTLRRPDDWHLHLRDGAMLGAVLPFTAAQMGRAIVMPNLRPPVVDAKRAAAYREEIRAALPPGAEFEPLMTAYLTDDTDPDDIEAGARDGVFTAAKLYPAHATTNSAHGVTDVARLRRVLERMEKIGLPLLVHGEVTDAQVDVFDREAVFLDRILSPVRRDHPGLKIVLEHVTTREGVEWVRDAAGPTAGTITAHHLLIDRNAMLVGGIRPHMYCLPVAKRATHRTALLAAATAGDGKFFLGTDSAPHPIADKESACGCAGIFTAPTALELYAEAFDQLGRLDRLEEFASLAGPRFYGLPANEARVTLVRRPQPVPPRIDVSGTVAVHPFRGGETVAFSLEPA
jgi:dihydroorotase